MFTFDLTFIMFSAIKTILVALTATLHACLNTIRCCLAIFEQINCYEALSYCKIFIIMLAKYNYLCLITAVQKQFTAQT